MYFSPKWNISEVIIKYFIIMEFYTSIFLYFLRRMRGRRRIIGVALPVRVVLTRTALVGREETENHNLSIAAVALQQRETENQLLPSTAAAVVVVRDRVEKGEEEEAAPVVVRPSSPSSSPVTFPRGS